MKEMLYIKKRLSDVWLYKNSTDQYEYCCKVLLSNDEEVILCIWLGGQELNIFNRPVLSSNTYNTRMISYFQERYTIVKKSNNNSIKYVNKLIKNKHIFDQVGQGFIWVCGMRTDYSINLNDDIL